MKHRAVAAACVAAALGLAACGRSEPTGDEAASQAMDRPPMASVPAQQDAPQSATGVLGAAPASPAATAEAAAAQVAQQAPDVHGSPLAEKIDDTQIVSRIKTEFAEDKDISAMAVEVDSKDGMVTLSGYVPNSEAKVRADQIARAMRDVRSVNNQLEVRAG